MYNEEGTEIDLPAGAVSAGYQNFFIWVMICTIPGFFVIRFLKIDPSFGIKKES